MPGISSFPLYVFQTCGYSTGQYPEQITHSPRSALSSKKSKQLKAQPNVLKGFQFFSVSVLFSVQLRWGLISTFSYSEISAYLRQHSTTIASAFNPVRTLTYSVVQTYHCHYFYLFLCRTRDIYKLIFICSPLAGVVDTKHCTNT